MNKTDAKYQEKQKAYTKAWYAKNKHKKKQYYEHSFGKKMQAVVKRRPCIGPRCMGEKDFNSRAGARVCPECRQHMKTLNTDSYKVLGR